MCQANNTDGWVSTLTSGGLNYDPITKKVMNSKLGDNISEKMGWGRGNLHQRVFSNDPLDFYGDFAEEDKKKEKEQQEENDKQWRAYYAAQNRRSSTASSSSTSTSTNNKTKLGE